MMFVVPVAAWADGNTGHGRNPSVVPADEVAGNTGGELVGDWFVDNLSLPADASPFGGAANLCLGLGRHGRVLAPAGGIADANGRIEMSCTVKAGRPVVMILTSADCSTGEPPPFYAATPKQQRACVVENLETAGVTSILVSVDGGRPVDVHRHRFFEISPQRHVVYPQNPVFGATPGPADFVAAAWMAQIRGMHRGQHTVESDIAFTSNGQTAVYPFVVHFTVVGRA
jgi:hypothetical protein